MNAKAILIALLLGPLAAWSQTASSLQNWKEDRPQAGAELAQWVSRYPAAARRMFLWDVDHPGRSQIFWRAVAAHPDETLEAFVQAHPHWPAVDLVLRRHAPAVKALIQWIHKHPAAVEEFSAVPRGFAWLGFHPYRQAWNAPDTEPDWNAPPSGVQQQ